jgi:drug/metabolite transporter (DMT)-like permease
MKNNLFLGVLLSLFGALFYSVQTSVVKGQGIGLPPLPVVIFMQSLIALALMLPLVFKGGVGKARQKLATNKLGLHVLRALFSLGISFLLFYSVRYIPLVNGLLLANTAPLIVPFIGYFFLSQKINHKLWVPILVGFAGVLIVLHPDERIFNPASFLAMGAAVCMSLSLLTVRQLSATDSSEAITFYFFLFSTLISGAIAIKFWVPLTVRMFDVMTIIGILYFLTQYTMSYALRFSNAQLVGALFYANIIYAAIISQVVWHILPSMLTFAGMLLVVIGGILCIRVEQQVKQGNAQLIRAELSNDRPVKSKSCTV